MNKKPIFMNCLPSLDVQAIPKQSSACSISAGSLLPDFSHLKWLKLLGANYLENFTFKDISMSAASPNELPFKYMIVSTLDELS